VIDWTWDLRAAELGLLLASQLERDSRQASASRQRPMLEVKQSAGQTPLEQIQIEVLGSVGQFGGNPSLRWRTARRGPRHRMLVEGRPQIRGRETKHSTGLAGAVPSCTTFDAIAVLVCPGRRRIRVIDALWPCVADGAASGASIDPFLFPYEAPKRDDWCGSGRPPEEDETRVLGYLEIGLREFRA